MTSLVIQNYPIDGSTSSLRQVVFGGPVDAINILLALTPNGDEGEADVEIVVGNGPEHEFVIPDTATILRNIADLLDEPETQESWLAALEDLNNEEEN